MADSNNFHQQSKKKYFVVIGLIIQISFMSISKYSYGEPIYSSFDAKFEKGLRCYNQSKFDLSTDIFINLAFSYPLCSRCIYYAGKSTGKLAYDANWFKATKLARKTLKFFQKAYLLNPNDYEITRDLAEYYQTAPSFLGGNQKKGNTLAIKANDLKKNFEQ